MNSMPIDNKNYYITPSRTGPSVGEGSKIMTKDDQLIGVILTSPVQKKGYRQVFFLDKTGTVHSLKIKGTLVDGKASKGIETQDTGIRSMSVTTKAHVFASKVNTTVEYYNGKYYACSSRTVVSSKGKPDGIPFTSAKGAAVFERALTKKDTDQIAFQVEGKKIIVIVEGEKFEVENTKENAKKILSTLDRYGIDAHSHFGILARMTYAIVTKDYSVYGFSKNKYHGLTSKQDKEAFIKDMANMHKELFQLLSLQGARLTFDNFKKFVLTFQARLLRLGFSKKDVALFTQRMFMDAKKQFGSIGRVADMNDEHMSRLADLQKIDLREPKVSLRDQVMSFVRTTIVRPIMGQKMDPAVESSMMTRNSKLISGTYPKGMSAFEVLSMVNLTQYRSLEHSSRIFKQLVLSNTRNISPETQAKISTLKNIGIKTLMYIGPKGEMKPVHLLMGTTPEGKACLIDLTIKPGDSDVSMLGKLTMKKGEQFFEARSEKEAIEQYSRYSPHEAGGALSYMIGNKVEVTRIEYTIAARVKDGAKALAAIVGTVASVIPGGQWVSLISFGVVTGIETGEMIYRAADGRKIGPDELGNIAIQWALNGGALTKAALTINRSVSTLGRFSQTVHKTASGLQFVGMAGMTVEISAQAISGVMNNDPEKLLGVLQNLALLATIHKINSALAKNPRIQAREYRKAFDTLSPEMKAKVFGREGVPDPKKYSPKEYIKLMQEASERLMMHTETAVKDIQGIKLTRRTDLTSSEKVLIRDPVSGKYGRVPENGTYAHKTYAEALRDNPNLKREIASSCKEGKAVVFKDVSVIPNKLMDAVHSHTNTLSKAELKALSSGSLPPERVREILKISPKDVAHAITKNNGKLDIIFPTENGKTVRISLEFTGDPATAKISKLLVRDIYSVRGGKVYGMSEDQLAKLDPEIRNNVPVRFLKDAHTTLNESTILYTKGTSQIAVKFNKNGEIVDIISIRGKSTGTKPLEKNPLERRDMTPQNDLRDFIDFLKDKGIKVDPKDFIAHGNETSKTMGWRLESKKLGPINEQIKNEAKPSKPIKSEPPIEPNNQPALILKDEYTIWYQPSDGRGELKIGTVADWKTARTDNKTDPFTVLKSLKPDDRSIVIKDRFGGERLYNISRSQLPEHAIKPSE